MIDKGLFEKIDAHHIEAYGEHGEKLLQRYRESRLSPEEVMDLSKLREQVRWFAKEMEKVLLDNDHKGGWDKCDDGYLIWMLRDNFVKLSELTFHESNDVQKVIKEAVDIANYAMMIADNARRGGAAMSDQNTCPACGNKIIHEGGCIHCIDPSCGWGQCG